MVTYNDIDFYVIKESGVKEDTVTLLKAKPLIVSEVETYGVGHINRYNDAPWGNSSNQVASASYDSGGIAFYTSETCGWVNKNFISTGCMNDYASSEVKYVVDSWGLNKLNLDDLKIDYTGHSLRLITIDELRNNLGYGDSDTPTENVPLWVYKHTYWTMSPKDNEIWIVANNEFGKLKHRTVYDINVSIRPVITLFKSALQ